MRFSFSAPLLLFCLALSGCALGPAAPPSAGSGLTIQGRVHGGQQPIVGAHIYLFAANVTGYGGPGIAPSTSNASISLLNATSTLYSDSLGAYVLSDANGGFSITGDYTCTPNSQVYLYALGGNPGGGVNSASGMMAVLGNCPATGTFDSSTYVWIDEVSTVSAAYAMAGFASDATHVSSSGTPLAQTGIANAFANAANLASLSTGTALATTPGGNGTVPQTKINTLANIIAACVNSSGPASTACLAVFANTLSAGLTGTAPTDTATAAINMAHNPGTNIAALFAIPTPAAPFAPVLSSQPSDFSILVTFIGGGLGYGQATAQAIAIDSSGDVWVASQDSPVVKLSNLGVILSGANGFTDGNQRGVLGIAIDLNGNAWVPNTFANSVTKISNSGSVLSGANGYPGFGSGGGSGPSAIAIDSADNVWVGDSSGTPLFKLSNSDVVLSGANGYSGGGLNYPIGIGIDGSGNAWVANYFSNSVSKLSSTGAVLSGSSGYSGGGIGRPRALAIDSSGNVWVTSKLSTPGGVTKLSNSGSVLVAVNNGLQDLEGIAIDGAGNAWITSQFPSTGIIELSSSGTVLSTAQGYTDGLLYFPEGIAIDGAGNVWFTDQDGFVDELVGAATPVITPIVAGLPSTPTTDGSSNLGTRP